jgi:transposase
MASSAGFRLPPGGVVAIRTYRMPAHKPDRIRELNEARGSGSFFYLPPYSPDLDPIEEAFSKIKGLLREAEVRSREALVEAMGKALSAVSTQDARGFFEHCGYHQPARLL